MTSDDAEVLTALIESGIDDEDVRDGMARLFLKSSVAVPSRTNPELPDGFAPLVSTEAGVPCVLVLTTSRALSQVEAMAPFAVEMTGAALVSMLAEGVGVRLDTGYRFGLLLPEYLAYLRQSRAEGDPPA